MNARPLLTSRLAGFGTTIFTEMTALATRFGAVNLGQGFPDFDGPGFVKEAAIAALRAGHNHYARMAGDLVLARAIAAHERRFYGLEYDPETEVTVHAGATEGLFAALSAFVDPGDEVIVFEPFYDSYPAAIALSGARLVTVPLRPPSFSFDPEALAAAVTPRTRVILLNSPHNPTGKVFTRAELEEIAALAIRHGLIAITDEVYEHIVFEGPHVPLATLPGMRERTVTTSSTGKTFSLTGWKIGYTCAPPDLAAAVRSVHQFVTFAVATPLQRAMAVALAAEDGYYTQLEADYRSRRERILTGLAAAGFETLPPQGTYFALADIRALGEADDVLFCRRLPEAAGVAAIPVTAFCVDKAPYRHLVRFAFCKRDETLDEGARRLLGLRSTRRI
jgi:N-succinyldiaminopimelate aminotransferase